MTVLVADDESALLAILAFNLKREGYEVWTAPDGDTAWRLVSTKNPDLVLLDTMMPGMTGPQVCLAMRADPALAGIPTILLSAREETDLAETAARCGASSSLAKPFHFADLLTLVRLLLSRP